MNTAELIVELVLTGLLMLAVLLTPAAVAYPELWELLKSGDLLAPLIAAGFILGVVVDRCADSVLETWEAQTRCKFATSKTIEDQRAAIGATDVVDRFPEDWMRNFVMQTGKEGAIKWGDQLRTRIRIARSVLIIAPALATSALLALWQTVCESRSIAWLPAIQFIYLLVALYVASKSAKPRTYDKPPQPEGKRPLSPVATWLGLQLLSALTIVIFVIVSANDTAAPAAAIGTVAAGAALTTIAGNAWRRITRTYMRFLWDFCRFAEPEKLRAAMQ